MGRVGNRRKMDENDANIAPVLVRVMIAYMNS